MAAKYILILTALLMAAHVSNVAGAAVVCDTSQLIPCLPAAKPNPEPPSGQCCNLIHAMKTDCLCAALQSNFAKAEGVDISTALQLPHKCGRIVPKGTKCGGTPVPDGTEHGEDDHEATEHDGMDHHHTMEHAMNHHGMDHEMEHKNLQDGMDQHENEESREQHRDEHQHVIENEMNHVVEPQMQNGMEQ